MDKRASSIAKGIAIIFMFIHHTFYSTGVIVRRIGDASLLNYVPIGQHNLVVLAQLFKICVSIFVFVTAYGTYRQVERNKSSLENGAYSISHYIKLVGSLLPILIIFGMMGFFTGYKNPMRLYFAKGRLKGILYLALDALCVSRAFNTPMMNPSWWYLSLAVLWIFLIPTIVPHVQKYGSVPLFALSLTLPMLAGFDFGMSLWRYLPTASLGLVCAQHRLFERWEQSHLARPLRLALLLVSGCILCLYRIRMGRLVYLFDPLLACLVCCFSVELSNISKLGILDFVGKHSANMYMIHNFLLGFYLTDLIYSPRNWILITLLLLLINVAISIVLELFKEKSHYNDVVKSVSQYFVRLFSYSSQTD